ncbi:MAG: sodium:proton antiporter, partial [Deltaproteobacteria bacterium]
WAPLVEVAILFAGIFVTMQPAAALLAHHGLGWAARLGLQHPWQFFWLTGLLSSMLDNAPTYVTATAVASSMVGGDPQHLASLCHGAAAPLLDAISCGAVMMGANTYLGNGPNFMVKALAERHGVRMPSFFAYMGYSGALLLPTFVLITLLFYR